MPTSAPIRSKPLPPDQRHATTVSGKRWQRFHSLVTVVGIGGVTHYLWLVKSDLAQPLIYAVLLVLLLGYRLVWVRRQIKITCSLRR